MPRAGGVYTLPAGNPVVTLTVISSSWANTTMSDIATALTGSLPTDGSAPLTGPLRLVDGIGGAPGLTWGSETTSGWYRIGLNQFGFSVAANLALSVNANRGWTIPTPVAATVGLTINSVANTAGLSIIGAAGSNAILALRDGQAGTTLWSISVGVGAVGELDIINNTAGTTPLKISAAGNVTVAAPTAGVALAVAGFAGANLAVLGGLVVATAGNVTVAAPTAGVALTVSGFAGANLAVLGGLVVTTAGNVTVAAPSSGASLIVTGVGIAGFVAALQIIVPATAGQSNGLLVKAGTNGGDACCQFNNAAGTATLLTITGDGSLLVGGASGGTQGAGTLNAIGLYAQGGVVSLFSKVVVQTATTSHGVAPATNDAVFTIALPGAGTYQFRLDAEVQGLGLGGGAATYNINYSGTFSVGGFAGYGIFAGSGPTNSGFTISTTAAGSTTNVVGGNPGASGATGAGSIIGTIVATSAGTLSLGWSGAAGPNGTQVGNGSFTVNRIA